MSSAGTRVLYINHVSTLLPYALTVAGVFFIGYLFLAIELLRQWHIVLPFSAALLVLIPVIIKKAQKKKA